MTADTTRTTIRVMADVLPTQVINTRERGIGRYTSGLVHALLRQPARDEFHVLVGNANLPLPRPIPSGAETPHISFFGDYALGRFRADEWPASVPGHAAYWRRQIERFAPHVFHIHNPFEWQTPPHSRYPRIATVVTVYDLIPLRLPEYYLHSAPEWLRGAYAHACSLVQHADHIIAISECTREDLIELLHIEPDRIAVAYPGPGEHFGRIPDPATVSRVRQRFGLAGGFVLSNSGFDPRKNLSRLLKAYAGLSVSLRREYPLVLVCRVDREQEKRLRDEARAYGISDRVIVTNFLSDEDLAALYHLATVQFFPSLYEGFGLPIIDSMLAGLPVVASRASAMPEIGADAVILADPLDVDALADALSRVLRDEGLQAALRQSGHSRAAAFSWEHSASVVRGVYRRLAGAPEKCAPDELSVRAAS